MIGLGDKVPIKLITLVCMVWRLNIVGVVHILAGEWLPASALLMIQWIWGEMPPYITLFWCFQKLYFIQYSPTLAIYLTLYAVTAWYNRRSSMPAGISPLWATLLIMHKVCNHKLSNRHQCWLILRFINSFSPVQFIELGWAYWLRLATSAKPGNKQGVFRIFNVHFLMLRCILNNRAVREVCWPFPFSPSAPHFYLAGIAASWLNERLITTPCWSKPFWKHMMPE